MAKTAILSNGNLNVGLNEFGLVSDFYFPDNGYENHTLGCDLFIASELKLAIIFLGFILVSGYSRLNILKML